MKWLLQGTIGTNPGDDFIRLGIASVVRDADPQARIEFFNREIPEQWAVPKEFDKAVWCGSPLFWSDEATACYDMDWWNGLLMGWISERKNDFLVLGAGSFARLGDLPAMTFLKDQHRMRIEAKRLEERAWRVYTRDWYAGFITGRPFPVLVCPSVLAVPIQEPEVKVCNFMPDGGHYEFFGPTYAARWREVLPKVAQDALDAGYIFAAHSDAERVLALTLGWTDDRIVGPDCNDLLNLYGRCEVYFGNRVHGAIVASVTASRSICVGYDSRLASVEEIRGLAFTPDKVVQAFNAAEKGRDMAMSGRYIISLRDKYVRIIKEFMEA